MKFSQNYIFLEFHEPTVIYLAGQCGGHLMLRIYQMLHVYFNVTSDDKPLAYDLCKGNANPHYSHHSSPFVLSI